jgi:hypothetical protein
MDNTSSERFLEPPKRKRRPWARLATGVILVLLGGIVYTALSPAPAPVLPNPNGYQDLLKAANALVGWSPVFLGRNPPELRGFVVSNRTAFALARRGLSRVCRVPVEYSSAWEKRHTFEAQALRVLGGALQVRARLAESDRRFTDAAEDCLDTIRLGQEMSRGGVLLDWLSGWTVEGFGLQELRKVGAHLDRQQRLRILHLLAELEARQAPLSGAFACERDWQTHTLGLGQRLRLAIMAVFSRMQRTLTQRKRINRSVAGRERIVRTLFRQVRQELAASATPANRSRSPAPLGSALTRNPLN